MQQPGDGVYQRRHLRLRADGDPYEIPNPIRIKPADQNSAFFQPAVQLPAGNGVRPGEIANALGLDPSSVVRVIDQLTSAGIMTRKEDESDRRAKLLSLTESGRDRIEVLLAAMRPFRAGLFKNINPAELEVTLKVLRELSESIRRNG